MYFLRILSKGVLWWHGNLHGKMHGNFSEVVRGKVRQNLREIPQLLAMGVGSQGNSRISPSKRFILGTFFLSRHSVIFIGGAMKLS